jgi:hypothetical protein
MKSLSGQDLNDLRAALLAGKDNPLIQLANQEVTEMDQTPGDEIKYLTNSPHGNKLRQESNMSAISQKLEKRETFSDFFPWMFPKIAEDAQNAVLQDPELMNQAFSTDDIMQKIDLHKYSLFITIFCSILVSTFISFAESNAVGDHLPETLFYVRLFSDLAGRPLALLPRPSCFRDIQSVFYATVIRALCSIFFFYYIATPYNYFYRNDYILIFFQVIKYTYYCNSNICSSK